MGVISTILGFSGFGIGVSAGVVIGYYLFIYFQPSDVKVNLIYPHYLIVFMFFHSHFLASLLYIVAACVFLFIILTIF
jgi:hypothetical protein